MNKDQAYHQIALACLKALKNTAASSEDPIKQLYTVIDEAFEQQTALLMVELEVQKARLNDIASLDPAQHTLADAQVIARHNGTAH